MGLVRGVRVHAGGAACEPCHGSIRCNFLWDHKPCAGFAAMKVEQHANLVAVAFGGTRGRCAPT
eukprot:3393114-Pyramimonas_sp.AAC.1